MMGNEQILVGLDIGTTKICALVTRKNENGKTEVLGIGKAPSHGVMRGEVANIDKTVQSIIQAVKDAEKQAGVEIKSVHVGIAGQHIKSMQHRGILTREDSQNEISKEDIKSLIRDMHKLAMNPGERIIHVLPQEFFVDSFPAKSDPIGMCGSRLEANFHIITGRVAAAQNIERCVEKAGLIMEGLILEPLASAASVLDEDEKEAGVALVDIGGGTTDLAIFQDGIIRHTCVIPFGGNIITEDIKDGCKIMKNQAEQLKVRFGSALAVEAKDNQIISIPGLKGRPPKEISMRNLANIIQARIEEIFEQVYFEIKASGYANRLNAGIVITGGGSQLKNIKQLVEYVTGLDARIGYPIEHLAKGYNDELKHPMFATGIGLVERAFKEEARTSIKIPVKTEEKVMVEHAEEEVKEEDVIQEAKTRKVNNWWKDMFKGIPDWLMDDNNEDFKD
ncbi:MAG: cell division protein FtsA [Chitinophagales bacterium]